MKPGSGQDLAKTNQSGQDLARIWIWTGSGQDQGRIWSGQGLARISWSTSWRPTCRPGQWIAKVLARIWLDLARSGQNLDLAKIWQDLTWIWIWIKSGEDLARSNQIRPESGAGKDLAKIEPGSESGQDLARSGQIWSGSGSGRSGHTQANGLEDSFKE